MRKQLLHRLLLLMAVITSCLSIQAQTFQSGGIYYKITKKNGSNVASVYFDEEKGSRSQGSYSGDVVIPETVKYEGENYTVASIEYSAFVHSDNLKSVYIPKTVSLCYPSFFKCDKLEKVEVSADNPEIESENNAIYTKGDTPTLLVVTPLACKGNYKVKEGVVSVASDAFCRSSFMTSLTLPKSLSSFNAYTVDYCENLVAINVDAGNEKYGSADGVLYDKNTKALVAAPKGLSGEYTVPDFIVSLCDFSRCNKLTKVTIPASVECANLGCFDRCENLKTIDCYAKYVDNIDPACPNLEYVNLMNPDCNYVSIDGSVYSKDKLTIHYVPQGKQGVFKINDGTIYVGVGCFGSCDKLTVIDIPASVTWLHYYENYNSTSYAIYCSSESKLEKFIIRGIISNDCYNNLKRLDREKVTVYVPASQVATVKSFYDGVVLPIDQPYLIDDFNTYIKGVSFKLKRNEEVPDNGETLKVMINDKELTPDANGLYKCFDLNENSGYTLNITGCDPVSFKTNAVKTSIKYTSTQSTITVTDVVITEDETYKPSKKGFTYSGKDYDFNGKEIKITGLSPSYAENYKWYSTYTFRPYGYYDGMKRYFNSEELHTSPISPTVRASKVGPTSVNLIGSYTKGDAKVVATYFIANKVRYDSDCITGLDPNTQYFIKYVVECEGNCVREASVTVKTTELELTTLQPKGVSPTCAIVAATTNMSSDEMSAGFQWKKYDAPASLKPSEGNAAIYEGQLEGYLKNLQSTSYYNVRAFYKSNAGNYYYGDWVTFDPSDFSFFEPTVHTYAVTSVSHNTADVRGYVLAGTDNITGQGFEYWSTKGQRRMKAFAPSADDKVMTVLSNGQVMSVTLQNLEPDTEYCYRAFVTTTAGTVYGEEMTFTTAFDPSGIGNVSVDESAVKTVIGYYDINGRRFEAPQRGLNIVRYSDGSCVKIVVK